MRPGTRRTNDGMILLFRCPKMAFWSSVAATVAWLGLSTSGPVANAFGVRGSQTVFIVLVATIAACSGLIQWTHEQLFSAIVFAINLFVAFLALPGRSFAARKYA